MRRSFLLLAFMLLSSKVLGQGQDYSHCVSALSSAAKEYSISTASTDFLNAVFSQECDTTGSWKAKSGSIGLDTIVKAIPVKLTGSYGDNQEAMRNFCRTYSASTRASGSSFSYSEKVAGKTLETFEQCVRFTAQGITVRTNPASVDAIAIDFTAGVGKPVEIQGLNSSKNLSCSGLHPTTKKKISYDDTTNVTTTETLSIVCRRAPTLMDAGALRYDEATILMPLKNFGTYSVLMPKDLKLPVDQASAIAAQLEALARKLDRETLAIAERIDGIKLTVSNERTLPDFGCGQQAVADAKSLEFMYGSRDGTGCKVRNVNWVKTIGLEVPAAKQ